MNKIFYKLPVLVFIIIIFFGIFLPVYQKIYAQEPITETPTPTETLTPTLTLTPTETPVPSPTPTPLSCADGAPGSAPQLTSATSKGPNQITLTWTTATDPVSYYLVSYGIASGQYIYGNPNVGGQGTSSYIVTHLAKGTTYYFVVRAGNGCTPGSFSNELSATTTGGVTASPSPPIATESGTILGTQISSPAATITKSVNQDTKNKNTNNHWELILIVFVIIMLILIDLIILKIKGIISFPNFKKPRSLQN